MRYMIELTDLSDGQTEPSDVVPADQGAAAVRGWYPANDSDIRPSELDSIEELQAALIAEDYSAARDIAAELAIGFDAVQVATAGR